MYVNMESVRRELIKKENKNRKKNVKPNNKKSLPPKRTKGVEYF